MNNDNKGMTAFRNSRKGYDKSDVNRYIEEMSIRFTSKEAKLKSRISELEGKLSAVVPDEKDKAEISRLNSENSELTSKNCELKTEMSELILENDGLKAEIARLISALAEAEAKKTETARSEPCPEYREMSEKLGSIMLKANLDAERIVAEAEAEASKQLSEAEKSADGIRLDAAVSARLMTSKVKERLNSVTEEYITGLKMLSEESVREYRRLCDELTAGVSRLGGERESLKSLY